MCISRENGERRFEIFIQQRVVANGIAEHLELVLGGKLAVDEQVADLVEGSFLRQVLDGVTAVAKNAVLTIDVRDGRFCGAGGLVTRVVGDKPRRCAQLLMLIPLSPSVAGTISISYSPPG